MEARTYSPTHGFARWPDVDRMAGAMAPSRLRTRASGSGDRSPRTRERRPRALAAATFLAAALSFVGPDAARADECGFGALHPNGTHTGTISHPTGVGRKFISRVAVQSDGRILLASQIDGEGVVTRYLRDGQIDGNFGHLGTVRLSFGRGEAFPRAIAVTGGRISRRIYVALTTNDRSNRALVCLNMDGTLNESFADGGKLMINRTDNWEEVHAMTVLFDGRIVLGGFSDEDCPFFGHCNLKFSLLRIHPDGSFDRSFGGDGVVVTKLGDRAQLSAMHVSGDGSILALGRDGDGPVAVRYLPDGRLDESFGRRGKKYLPLAPHLSAKDVLRRPDGSYLLLTGNGVFRMDPDGGIDRDFAGGFGHALVPDDVAGIALGMTDGFFTVGSESDAAVVYRYGDDGVLDSSWATKGIRSIEFAREHGTSFGRAIAATGRGLVVAGKVVRSDSRYGLALLGYDGHLVRSCEPVDPEDPEDPEDPVDPVDPPPSEPRFRRGDTNASGRMDISDAILSLSHLFGGSADVECLDALDANDDGAVNISDPSYMLNYLFSSGRAPAAPGAVCGVDPTADGLGCEKSSSCE